MTTTTAAPARWSLRAAALLHLTVLPVHAASGLLAPGWAVLSLLALWAVLGGVLVVVHRRVGALALLVPAVALGLWFALVSLGEQLLGWTA